MTPVPPTLPASALEEIDRLAREATKELKVATADIGAPPIKNGPIYRVVCRELWWACTPERITALVAMARAGAEDTARVRGILDASPLDHYPNRPTKLDLILCGGGSVACHDGDKLAALDRWLANRANGTPTTDKGASEPALEDVAAASHPAALTPPARSAADA